KRIRSNGLMKLVRFWLNFYRHNKLSMQQSHAPTVISKLKHSTAQKLPTPKHSRPNQKKLTRQNKLPESTALWKNVHDLLQKPKPKQPVWQLKPKLQNRLVWPPSRLNRKGSMHRLFPVATACST